MLVHIVDDDEAVRDSLSILLRSHNYEVACYESADAFLARPPAEDTACVLIDLQMPGTNGLDLLRKLLAAKIRNPVVMMTGHAQVTTAVQAMKAGAADFLEKPLGETELLSLLGDLYERSMHRGEVELKRVEAESMIKKLTTREKEIFDHLVLGMQNKAVALELGISPRTVELHRARIMEKLRARSLSDLVRLSLNQVSQ